MANSPDHPDYRVTLDTDAGPIDAWAQNERTFLVRVGEYQSTTVTEPLDLGHGIKITVHAHFKRHDDGSWRSWSPSYHRADHGRSKDVTSGQARRADRAIADALHTYTLHAYGAELLQRAGRTASMAEATARTDQANELRKLADHLDREAYELIHGGRVAYYRAQIAGSGADAKLTCVVTAAGERMDAPREAPTIYGARRYAAGIYRDYVEQI